MTIQSQLIAGFQAVATSARSLRTLVTGTPTGNISGIITTDKTSIVAAINELKAPSLLGNRYTFSMAAQPRVTWVQATGLTLVNANTSAQITQSGGAFTFAAGTVANVARNWMFYIDCFTPTQDNADIAVEMRVNGTSVARAAIGSTSLLGSLHTTATLAFPLKISGGEVVTFWFMHNYSVLIGSTACTMQGQISMVAL